MKRIIGAAVLLAVCFFLTERPAGAYIQNPISMKSVLSQTQLIFTAGEHHRGKDAVGGVFEPAVHRHHDGIEAAEQRAEREQVGQDVDALPAPPRRQLELARLAVDRTDRRRGLGRRNRPQRWGG